MGTGCKEVWELVAEMASPWRSGVDLSPVFLRPCSVWQEHWGEPKSGGTLQGCQEPIIPLRGPSASHSAR